MRDLLMLLGIKQNSGKEVTNAFSDREQAEYPEI